MVKIKVLDITKKCSTNEDGFLIFEKILPLLQNGEKVELSFKDVYIITTSFINSAFIELLGSMPFSTIKGSLTFVDSTRFINQTIKDRFSFEVKRQHGGTCTQLQSAVC